MSLVHTLAEFTKNHDFFVGLDSDGCVFDSMEIKHKECFTPMFVKHFRLQAAAKYARRVWEFANLYSVSRGMNRFPVLVRSLELLGDWPDPMERGLHLPDLAPLKAFIDSGLPPSNAGLTDYMKANPHPLLDQTMAWSLAVNAMVKDIVEGVPPFPKVRECLDMINAQADLAVVSGTPGEALVREWEENEMLDYPKIIAGQELGKKTDHLREMAGGGRYEPGKKLMIGDAPGDLKAAQASDCLFYPINPGHEEESWQRLHDEALGRFFAGTYAGEYEAARIAEFDKLLPSTPPWK
ncbi:MAG: HAD hydrolase-like protein [Acidobacteria bacterium]|nr:HAD hydrolase-like protein [Acidobacteriota bacterium]